MRTATIHIKRYKANRGRHKPLFILLLAGAAACLLFFLIPKAPLPSFLTPSLTKEDMARETRVLTLPSDTWYALQLGAFSEQKSAVSLAELYRSRGAAGYIHQPDNYRVLAAAYANRADARAVQEQLAQKHGVDAYIHPLSRSEVTLRLHGQKAQLDALSDVFDLCRQLPDTLAHLSQSLDNGSLTREEVLQALQSQRQTLQTLTGRLQALFAREEHPAVLGLMQLTEKTDQCLTQALAAENNALLGSRVKYAQLMLLCCLEEYVLSLGNAPQGLGGALQSAQGIRLI